MGNRLSSDSWLKARDKLIKGQGQGPGVFKLVDDLLIGGRGFKELAERVGAPLERYRNVGFTLASN